MGKREKLTRLLGGERVVASDMDMSYFEAEVDNYPILYRLASIHNPECSGLKNKYIAFVKTPTVLDM